MSDAPMPETPQTPIDHPFDQAIALLPGADGSWVGRTTPAYGNMVGPFGGITAAVLLNAVLRHPQCQGEPLALTVNYAGPVAEGAFAVQARAGRTNRSSQHWLVEQVQGEPGSGAPACTTASALLGTRRQTWSANEITCPEVPEAAVVARPLRLPRVAWMANYDQRYVDGAFPDYAQGAADQDSTSVLWVRDEPPRPLDFASLAAICDVFFPRIFLRRRRYTPAGTVTSTTYFHVDGQALAAQGTRHVLALARAQRYGGGWFDQTAQVWGADRTLLATSHQLVYFKD